MRCRRYYKYRHVNVGRSHEDNTTRLMTIGRASRATQIRAAGRMNCMWLHLSEDITLPRTESGNTLRGLHARECTSAPVVFCTEAYRLSTSRRPPLATLKN